MQGSAALTAAEREVDLDTCAVIFGEGHDEIVKRLEAFVLPELLEADADALAVTLRSILALALAE